MTESIYHIRQCERRACGFRFPTIAAATGGTGCPLCGARAILVDAPYGAHEVKTTVSPLSGPEVEALLDNIRSIFNVGNMLRTADGAGIRHVHLCGITPSPRNPKLAKTALGAERTVAWTEHRNGLTAAVSRKEEGLRLWALEGGPRSQSLFEALEDLHGSPIVLVVGSEVCGIDPGILEQCDRVFCLPMQGSKTTLNVAVAFGIAAYLLRFVFPFMERV